MHSFEFEQTGKVGRITVDGVDISDAVAAVSFESRPAAPPQVTLGLLIHDVTRLGSTETELLIPEETAAALVALGWTPPTE